MVLKQEYQANYLNTLAQRESDCTFNAGLRSWIHMQHFINKTVKFVHALTDEIEAC